MVFFSNFSQTDRLKGTYLYLTPTYWSLSLKDELSINWRCDQMARLLVRYLAICNNEKLPNTITNLPK